MCEHERLKTVGDTVYCAVCGVALPLEFLMEKGKSAEPKQFDGSVISPEPEPIQESIQEPAQVKQNEAENPAPAVKAGKSTTKGTGGKKAAKTPKKAE